jgi:hypothetical protein
MRLALRRGLRIPEVNLTVQKPMRLYRRESESSMRSLPCKKAKIRRHSRIVFWKSHGPLV